MAGDPSILALHDTLNVGPYKNVRKNNALFTQYRINFRFKNALQAPYWLPEEIDSTDNMPLNQRFGVIAATCAGGTAFRYRGLSPD